MRSNRTPAVYFDDILMCIRRLESYFSGLSYPQFREDTPLQDAILYRLLVLTEAARRLRPDELALCSGPDWPRICGLGNIIRHDYDGIELEAIWNIAQDDLSRLKEAVEQTMREHFPDVPRS